MAAIGDSSTMSCWCLRQEGKEIHFMDDPEVCPGVGAAAFKSSGPQIGACLYHAPPTTFIT